MNTQITNALSDAELELVAGGCYKRCEDSESSSYDSSDYGCEGSYDSSDYGCEGSYDSSDYGSCHKRGPRRFHRRHHSCE